MFSFGRKKPIDQDDESIKEIEKIVQTLDQDGSGRIRIKDLESALQRIDEDSRSKPEIKNQVRSFSEWSSFDLTIHARAILHRLSHCYSSQIVETERGPNRWRQIHANHARTAKTTKVEVTSSATPTWILRSFSDVLCLVSKKSIWTKMELVRHSISLPWVAHRISSSRSSRIGQSIFTFENCFEKERSDENHRSARSW